MTIIYILVTLLLGGLLSLATFAAHRLTGPMRWGGRPAPGSWAATATPQSVVGVPFEDLTIPARTDGHPIAAWFVPADGATAAIIVAHGKDKSRAREFQGNALHVMRALHRHGFAVLMIDLRGHGTSGPHRATYGLRERRDVLGAVDWLLAQGFAPGKIGVLGASMGAAASIGATAEEPRIGALATDSAYAAITPMLQGLVRRHARALGPLVPLTLGLARLFTGVNIAAARPVDEIGRIAPRPLLIMHGTHDWLIPPADAALLHAAAPGSELWVVRGAGHVRIYAFDPEAYVARVVGFFARSLR